MNPSAPDPGCGEPSHPRIAPLTVQRLLAGRPAPLPSVGVEATVSEALESMVAHGVPAVPVVDGNRVVGIFSEGDYARHACSGSASLHESMSAAVFATPAQSARECVDLMNAGQTRFLVVIDNGELLGLLSLDDLLQALVVHYEEIFHALALDQRILFLQGTYSC